MMRGGRGRDVSGHENVEAACVTEARDLGQGARASPEGGGTGQALTGNKKA